MNAGMYTKELEAQGLFIDRQKIIVALDTASGGGNFYMKPNGVFYLTSNNAALVCKTNDFKNNGTIKYATQSGPMLVIDGRIHPAFTQSSNNLNIRNGVGILPDNKVVFAISKTEINFYDLQNFSRTWDAETLCIWTAFCRGCIYQKGTGYKPTETLG